MVVVGSPGADRSAGHARTAETAQAWALRWAKSAKLAGGTPVTLRTSSLGREPAFARSFQRALGQAPMQYVTSWRMTLARDYLRTGRPTLTQLAERTGYTSPYAFAAAFRRHHGQPPGLWRQQQQEQPATGSIR